MVAAADTLLERALAGDVEARNELVTRKLPLIAGAVNRMKLPRGLVGDMVQEAVIGILKKFPSYDPAKSEFTGWVAVNARRSVVDALREGRALLIRVPRQDYERMRAAGQRPVPVASLDTVRSRDDDLTLGDMIEDHATPNETIVARNDEAQRELRKMTAREAFVFSRRHGLYPNGVPLTMKEVGALLGVSESLVHQIYSTALRRARGEISRVPPRKPGARRAKPAKVKLRPLLPRARNETLTEYRERVVQFARSRGA